MVSALPFLSLGCCKGFWGVSGIPISNWQRMLRLCFAAIVALTSILPTTTVSVSAAPGGDRTLYMRHTHTGEVGKFTYRRNGEYDKKVLQQLNVFLADWRTKEPTKMDPALFDLIWAVYQEVGANQPVNIVSSYRSPKTNATLRSKSSGVAENSQHMKGKAIDFYIPGVKLATLREAVMRRQVGGIGYYPTSGSPFVHADTGSVRAWPRMTRAQLKKVFPDGRTLHVPTDGTPLSSQGRAYAEAEWKKCRTVPCNGAIVAAEPAMPAIMVADQDGNIAPIPLQRPRQFYGSSENATIMVASLAEPTQREVSTFAVAPTPLARPAKLGQTPTQVALADDLVPFPAARPARLLGANGPGGALEAIDNSAPQPRILMTPKEGSDIVAAYAPGNAALKMLIESEKTPLANALKPGIDTELVTASLGGDALKGMFDMTFNSLTAVAPAGAAAAVREVALSRQPIESIKPRATELVAPEMDHVNETLTMPVLMSDSHFAELYEAEGYLDKEAELGPMAGRMAFLPDLGQPLDYDQFVTNAPLLVAIR
jgi:uncharacterized protein YcbK (DUF882 family)